MAFEFIQPNAIDSSANLNAGIAVGDVDNITDANFADYNVNNGQSISPSTDPDGVFLTADENGPTNVTVSFPNPSQGTGEVRDLQRRGVADHLGQLDRTAASAGTDHLPHQGRRAGPAEPRKPDPPRPPPLAQSEARPR